MKKRIISFVLALVMICGVIAGIVPKADALHLWIQDRSALSGKDYTKSDIMAQKLEEIFDGNISVYYDSRCTQPVKANIGSYVMKISTPMYAGPYGGPSVNYGSSCWIYAQGVYYTLFEDYVMNNRGQTGNSESIDLTTTAAKNCTYANFRAWGVRQGVGAMLRTSSHSMIVLGYDEQKLITLEGNVTNGLVCVRERSWDQVAGNYFTFIVQPTEEYMQRNYNYCNHEQFSGTGYCSECGFAYNWKRTFDSSAIGYYTVVKACAVRSDVPYIASNNILTSFTPGETVEVKGSVENAFGEIWYELRLEDGTTGYAQAECFKFEEDLSLQVTCTGFKPDDQQTLKAASYPLGGTVKSNYPLKRIDAYLDDTWYAAWTASNQNTTTVTLNATSINYNLTFSTLSVGTHVIKLVATDYVHTDSLNFHKSTFYILPNNTDDCVHNYAHIGGLNATCTEEGLLTYQCEYCSNTFTEAIPERGHNYQSGYCAVCGAVDVNYDFVASEVTVGAVTGSPGQTVSVPVQLAKNPGVAIFAFNVAYDTSAMTLTGVTKGALLQEDALTLSDGMVSYNGTKNISGDGTLFYLNFTLANNATIGEKEISLSLRSNSTWYFRDENNNARDINLNAGKIAVIQATTPSKFDVASARMILGNALEFQFAVPKSGLSKWTGAYAVIAKDVAGGSQTTRNIPAAAFSQTTINGVEYWVLTYDGLAAKEMADNFYVTIYNAQNEAVSNVYTDSVRSYVMRNVSIQNAETKTMMVDMLCYGAAAQTNFGYNTGDLADNQLTAAQKAWGTQTLTAVENELVKGKNYLGSRLVLESRIQMQIAFAGVTQDMYATYVYTDHFGNQQTVKVNGKAFVLSGSVYCIELDQLVYADARQPVTVTVYNADGTVHGSATDSIESYASRFMDSLPLVESLMKFTDSAYAYFH